MIAALEDRAANDGKAREGALHNLSPVLCTGFAMGFVVRGREGGRYKISRGCELFIVAASAATTLLRLRSPRKARG